MKNYSLVINVGAQKSGTSWLYKCLEDHPDICTSSGKETHFFSRHYNNGTNYVSKYFDRCDKAKFLYEGSTSYLYSKEAPKRIKSNFPTTKIIIILRDPVSRTLSHINHIKNKKKIEGKINILEFSKIYPEVIENSRYKKNVPDYISSFGKDSVLILDYEEIKNRPQKLIDTVCDFIGARRISPRSLNFRYNSGKARSNKYYKTATRLYLRLKKYMIFNYIFWLLKTLKIDSLLLEKMLIKTTRNQDRYSGIEELEEILSEEIEYYKKTIFLPSV
tara:strand:+ start:14460 stop:15284 length:825 start_codon:yes stop_codon:yes gene_type:complete